MTQSITIRWHELGESVNALLLDKENAYACEEFAKLLPVESIQSHAVVAGNQMYAPIRFTPERALCNFENMAEQPEGRVNIELDFQYLSINYGPMTEAVPTLAVAQIVDSDIARLREIGRKVWDNLLYGSEYIHVYIEEGENA